jgi:hypothetical protein
MRWVELFRFLEESGVPELHSFSSGGNDPPLDDALLGLFLRAKSHKKPVTTTLVTGRVFHIWPRAVGRDWLSGLIGQDQQAGVVIPVSAIEWAESEVTSPMPPAAQPTRASFRDALADMVQRSQRVTVDTPHRRHDGVLASVGIDYVDLCPTTRDDSLFSRRLPLSAVVMITVGGPGWG